MSDTPRTIDRRGALKRLGAACVPGLVGLPGTAGAQRQCRDHWANGAVLDCFINFSPQHRQIFETMSRWENSVVSITRPEWEGDVTLRVGEVSRVTNDRVLDKYEHYVVREHGSTELGDERHVMLAGDSSLAVSNKFDYRNHCGFINESRCLSSAVSVKYWYHELGHAHSLNHRSVSGSLMAPWDWYGMRLDGGETSRWRDAFEDTGSCSRPLPQTRPFPEGAASRGDHVAGNHHGLAPENPDDTVDEATPDGTVDPPVATDIRPL